MSSGTPTVFGGRYELHRRLARGGMADVFVARDQLLGRPVAVKVLFPEFAADPKFVERFRREAQSAASLNHPNIVSIYDWGEERGTYFIVMEYVEGQSLAQILRREGRLSAEQVTRVTMDVSLALGFAHEGGVVHRDVKPGNVLVSPKGEMKVADFGIATAMTQNGDANLTQTGAVMGTATYFSPEQAQGHKVDHRSDLYSLGVVMYEMLTGVPPFAGETPVSIAYKHVQEQVVPVSERNPDIPPALAAITMKLLSKNPDNRYPSADALFADLDRFRQGQAIAAAAAAHPGVAAGNVPTTALPQQVAPVRQQQGGTRVIPATYEAPPRRKGGLIFAGLVASLLILGGFLVLLSNQGNLFGTNGGDDLEEPTAVEVATVEIPALGGQGEADAASQLRSRGFEVETRLVASDNIAIGSVIQTEPAAGTSLAEGSLVTLVVSSGPNASQVPSVLTMNENDALQTLSSAGFTGRINRVTSQIAPEGEVIAQDPAPSSFLRRGETVTIDVSAGVEEIPIPDVLGTTLEEARATLEAEGFTVSPDLETAFDDEVPMNSVVDTIPPPGTPLPPGGTITLIISDGPDQEFLPNWIGQNRDTVRADAAARGLVIVEFGRVVNDPGLFNRVIEQLPAPNSFVIPGNQVQIIVGVPDPAGGQAPAPAPTTPPAQPQPNTGTDPVPAPTADPAPAPTADPALGGQGDAQPGDGFDDG